MKKIYSNFGYLSALQIVNIGLPFITYPYLVKILGSEKYGLIVFILSIHSILSIIINYGFNIYSTKEISINRKNQIELSKIFSSTIIIKSSLLVLSFILLFLLTLTIDVLNENRILTYITFSICIYETFFPVWYFQGIENMKVISLINIATKVVFSLAVFIFISKSEDYMLYPIFLAIGHILASIISMHLVFRNSNIKFSIKHASYINQYLMEAFPFFLSRGAITVISKINYLIIGNYFSFSDVTIYDLGMKISEILKLPSGILNQAIYPNVAKTKNMKIVKQSIRYTFIFNVIALTIFVLFGKSTIDTFLNNSLTSNMKIYYILNFSIIFTSISYFLGNTTLVVHNLNRYFNLSIILQLLITLILTGFLYLIGKINIFNLSFVFLISSIFEFSYRLYYSKKYNLL